MTKMFERDHQKAVDNMDVTYARDGLTLSGHLRAMPGKEGADLARKLGEMLLEAATELEQMDPIEIDHPDDVQHPFGKAFE